MQIKNILFTAILGLSATSCNLLGPVSDIEPDYVLTDENVITNAQSAEYLLNGIYTTYRTREFSASRTAMLLMSGTLKDSDVDGSASFARNEVRIETITVQQYYTSLYFIINQANSLISGLANTNPQGLSAERKAEILGEAYFHKAFAETMLLRSFGEFWDVKSKYGIILYNEPVRKNESQKSRSSVNDTYTQILADLEQAAKAPGYEGKAYRISKLAVKALKVRVMLYMNNYPEASRLAQEVINEAQQSGISLESNYLDIFAQGFSSKELLFAPYASYPLEIVEANITDQISRGIGETVTRIADELNGQANDGKPETGEGYDSRYAQTFENSGGQIKINKYVCNSVETGDNNTIYFMRLAEMYLIKAEADARRNQPKEARAALKFITDRAGYDENYVNTIADKDLLLAIFRHKYMELFAENNEEWYDMVRYSVLDKTDFVSLKYATSMRNLVLPIPAQAISGNNKLEQNPTYQN